MKKYSVKLASLVLFFATGATIGMEAPKRIHLENLLSPMQIPLYGPSNYTLACIINDIDDKNQPNYTKYASYNETVYLGLSDEIKTLKIRLSGPGTEKGAYVYDNLTDELKKQIAAKEFDPNYTDLTIIVQHARTSGGKWIPKQYDYTWKWNKPKDEAQAKPIKSISMTLDGIIKGELGQEYAKKVTDICNADYTKTQKLGLVNLCHNLTQSVEPLFGKLSQDIKTRNTFEIKTTKDEIKETINRLHKKFLEWRSQGKI